MRKVPPIFIFIIAAWACVPGVKAQEGLIPAFPLRPNDLTLARLARPGTPFNKVGHRFAVLADEGGSFEAWAYPLKLFRQFGLSFFVGSSTSPIRAKDIVRHIRVSPEATTLTFTFQSFTVRAHYIAAVDLPGAILLLQVDSIEPLTIVCGFLPVLEPMWPAGLGGQYAFWNNQLKAYIISEPTAKNHGLVGSPAASGISYTPAHMLSDTPSEFKIECPDPDRLRDKYIPIYMAGGKGPREDILKVYEKLQLDPQGVYENSWFHHQRLQAETLKIRTPEKKLDMAFAWAKVTFDNLLVENPDLGRGLVAGWGASGTSSRPGFGWFFGGDAYINSLSILSYGGWPTVKQALAFTQKWQREDGKMAHELSQGAGYIDWWNDYHYGYIHGDTTPYYIAVMYEYMRRSGDTGFITESWDSLERAFAWCLTTDANGDGLMDNKQAGLGALEYGTLTSIATDVYLGAVWVRACWAMARMAELTRKPDTAEKASQAFLKAKEAFDQRFWDKDNQFYAYAFNTEGEHVKDISPWSALGLMWELGTPERSQKTLKKLSSSEILTDWGVRSISVRSRFFQPLNYNYGAVWPFLTSWVTSALYKHHLPLQGYSLLWATARHTFDHALGCITEVFSGRHNIWPQEAVCQQGFSSAAVVLPLVQGLLGLEGDALKKTVTFAPHFPGHWDHVQIKDYKVGEAVFSFDYAREKSRIRVRVESNKAAGYRLHFAPALGLGSKVKSMSLNGEALTFGMKEYGQVVQAEAGLTITNQSLMIEAAVSPTLEILPAKMENQVGARNRGLKIISVRRNESTLDIHVEGLSGQTYELAVLRPELIAQVKGASANETGLIFTIPSGPPGDFVSHRITLFLKQTADPDTAFCSDLSNLNMASLSLCSIMAFHRGGFHAVSGSADSGLRPASPGSASSRPGRHGCSRTIIRSGKHLPHSKPVSL